MALIANRRSVMTLFSDPACIQSHRTRIVLSEKDITADVVQIDHNNKPEDLSELNPYNSVPTLVDRDLVLYDSRVIMEYFDERFPHPPLMPVDPVSRSKSRLALFHIEKDWYRPADTILNGDAEASEQARKILEDSLISSIEIFSVKPYFLSDDFSLVDCSMAPLLWRLPSLNIHLPPEAKAIVDYGNRVFDRPSFRSSLTEEELEMRPI
jgi:RNA polymerase-associated protein